VVTEILMKEKKMPQTKMPEATDSNPVSDSNPVAPIEDAADDSALKKRLLSRIAVAGVVILGLLGGLAVFEVLNKPQEPALPKMAAAPIEPAAPALKAGEEPTGVEQLAEDKAADAAPVPERTETALAPPPSAKSLTLPATPRTASIKPPPSVAPAKPDLKQEIAKAIPERTAPASAPTSTPKPLAQVVESAKRFLVQVGVFSNHANAEELMTKLQAAGIPAQVESRVQVGPFASRAEADAARAKLKSMGIDDGLLVRR
jgi:DedD protein